MIFPTPAEQLTDPQGRLTFLWDVDVTKEQLAALLHDPDPEVRGYWIGKLLRQAKPDDVPRFVCVAGLQEDWEHFERYLGHTRPMWEWLLRQGWTGE